MKTSFFKLFKKNLLYLLSLILAVIFWFYVLSKEPLEIEKEVALHFIIPNQFAIDNDPPFKAMLTVKGPRAFMRHLNQGPFTLELDISAMAPTLDNKYQFNLSEVPNNLPFGVSLLSTEPSQIELELARAISKRVPIEPNLVGDVDPNHRLI